MPSQFCRHVSTWIVSMALKLTDFSLFQKGHKQSKSEYQLNDQVSAWYQSTQSAFYIFEWRSATGFLLTGWGVWADKIPLEKITFHWFSLLLFPKAISTTNRPLSVCFPRSCFISDNHCQKDRNTGAHSCMLSYTQFGTLHLDSIQVKQLSHRYLFPNSLHLKYCQKNQKCSCGFLALF